jgi:hypothetical protein
MDTLIIYLAWAKSGLDYSILAKLLGLKESRCENDVRRMRPLLHATDTWFTHRAHPTIVEESLYPHVALLIDNLIIQCFRSKDKFTETKTYFDRKNKIYGLKSEVAVDVVSLHYCRFVQSHEHGSKHDYQTLKTTFTSYLGYLLKQPDEAVKLPGDAGSHYWASVVVKMYPHPTPT